MHIVLLILKILGITLASIIGLVLLLLIILLAVPIRYRFELKVGDEQELTIKAGVHWLLYLISVKASYIGKELSYQAKLCGKQLAGNQKEFLEKQEQKKQKKAEKERKKQDKDKVAENAGKPATTTPTDQELPEADIEIPMTENEIPEEEIPEAVPAETGEEETISTPEEDAEPKKSILDKIRNIPEKIKDKWIIIQEKIKGFFDKMIALYRKITDFLKKDDKEEKEDGALKKYKALLDTYQKNGTLSFLLKYLKKIIKHVLPRKLKGYVKLGLDDPSATGYITAAAAILFPVYGKSFSYEPNFYEKELDVAISGHGKIRLGYFLYVGLRLILRKNVRQLIKDIRNI